ncbi:hypothetical protein RFI_27533 [Reticulomyxa filosa]|uniref:Uncharacterized protein n=1 Tax=Reticulomyxa filosa TaxID=46433 RepID=X6M7D5_RETFI|nr:hypothetical protein RFI_27533 [Reticulomyxa filosa]|eukprot:ETO09844.1 hypothetical protein RFI_27533 [Reticulomyxa filosa]
MEEMFNVALTSIFSCPKEHLDWLINIFMAKYVLLSDVSFRNEQLHKWWIKKETEGGASFCELSEIGSVSKGGVRVDSNLQAPTPKCCRTCKTNIGMALYKWIFESTYTYTHTKKLMETTPENGRRLTMKSNAAIAKKAMIGE